LRPHVENHGLYSIEWSYHFPLSAGLRIESQLDLDFPGEKVPGAARSSLRDANLSTTRLSFADTAATVRAQSLKFLKDTLWLLEASRAEGAGKDPRYLLVSNAEKSFVHVAREYWTTAFFARLGVILQSDLKAGRNSLRDLMRTLKPDVPEEARELAALKGELLQSFRSALRLVRARLVWEQLLAQERRAMETAPDPSEIRLSLRFVQQVRDLSELALSLVSASVAELQGGVREGLLLTHERMAVFQSSHVESPEHDKEVETALAITERYFQKEKRWLSEWARIVNDQRELCGLPSLVDIASDASLATTYFERVRRLKKLHYHVWDLDLDLVPNDKRIDFWIGAGAALISGSFVFATLLLFNMEKGAFGQGGVVAVLLFVIANGFAYMARDRMKEWLNLRLRKVFNLRTGRWTGQCVLRRASESGAAVAPIEVAQMERESWWTEVDENWGFHVWEEFRIAPQARDTDARIVKQVWRLPLDEILHTLDNTRHILKLPSVDGEPREVPVLKHAVFPFRLRVRVKSGERRDAKIIDTASVVGRVHTAGDHVVQVEVIEEVS